jgi:hypothetical protein
MRGWRPGRAIGDDRASGGVVTAPHVERRATPAAGSAALLAGLDPGRIGIDARAAALAHLGGLAGNAAVAGFVGRVRTDLPQDPPNGVRDIRRVGGGGTLGHTRALMDPSPPLFRLQEPETRETGVAVRPNRTRAPELDFEVRYPTPGRHQLYEGIFLDVSADWSATILQGEEEHVADQTIAWQDSWRRVADAVNAMADGPPVTGANPDEARRAAWRQFVASLPQPLRPAGRDPAEESQLAAWGFEQPNSAFRRLIGESKRARDDSQWHTPDSALDHMEGETEVRVITRGSSRIPGTTPEEVMRAAWGRLPTGGR